MARILRSPKAMTALAALGILTVLGLAGGALGNKFGGGFLASPIPHLQIAAEPLTAEPLFGGFKITNTMVATWVAMAVLIALAYFGTRRVTLVPRGLQNLLEVFIEFFVNLTSSVAGEQRGRRFFPLVMTIFIFIVAANWLGILPGFGTIGLVESPEAVKHHAEKAGEKVDLASVNLQVFRDVGGVAVVSFDSLEDVTSVEEWERVGVEPGNRAGRLVPFLRSANTDINSTLAIALVAMFMVHWWGFGALGFLGHGGKFVNLRQGPVWFAVGILEVVSELARVISFTFRLFGNIFAGEVLLAAMGFMIPLVGIIPFLGLELFVGLIQAFIFAMLTLVFATAATATHGAESH